MSETETQAEMREYLTPGRFIDSDHPAIIAFARETAGDLTDPRQQAIALYMRVRDEIRYDPYGLRPEPDYYKASSTLAAGAGFCVTKSGLMAAAARVLGIPARVGYADVRNHLTSDKLKAQMGTDLFVFHGYVELFLEGAWVKATPVFNLSLCQKTGVLPLEFDGREDSIFHPFDASGRQHMEYVRDRGTYADIPFEEIQRVFAETYRWTDQSVVEGGDFEAEARAE